MRNQPEGSSTVKTKRPGISRWGWVQDETGRLGQVVSLPGWPALLCTWAQVCWADTSTVGTVVWPRQTLRPVPAPLGPTADLVWPPPQCPIDGATAVFNSSGWACPRCHGRWDTDGHNGERICATPDCLATATVNDAGKPRCPRCAGGDSP